MNPLSFSARRVLSRNVLLPNGHYMTVRAHCPEAHAVLGLMARTRQLPDPVGNATFFTDEWAVSRGHSPSALLKAKNLLRQAYDVWLKGVG